MRVLATQQSEAYKQHRPETTLLYQLIEPYYPGLTAPQRLIHSEVESSPRLVNIEDGYSEKLYHAREMTWAQRLKRAFNFDITECEKCEHHSVSIIVCIIDSHLIQKIHRHLDKKYPTSA